MILIKNVEVYSPEYLGKKDILIGGEKILRIKNEINLELDNIKIIDGVDKKIFPGFIDQHVHITGGGGEGSFKTRVPEISLSELTEGGITTVVGLLGTDGVTRTVENVLAKTKALNENGITTLMHTGSYRYPSLTITDSIQKDIVFIDEIIGVKIALADHRSSQIGIQELKFIGSEARTAGMLSGKAGIVVVHMGDGKKQLQPIISALENSELPIQVFRATHVNRNRKLLNEGFEFIKKDGIIDLTCGIYDELSPAAVIKKALEEKLPLKNITVSSDGYGSWSNYDENGNLIEIGVSSVKSLYKEFVKMVDEFNFTIEEALIFFTTNIAKALKIFPKKGKIIEGADADLILANKSLEINSVIARGKIMILENHVQKKGLFE